MKKAKSNPLSQPLLAAARSTSPLDRLERGGVVAGSERGGERGKGGINAGGSTSSSIIQQGGGERPGVGATEKGGGETRSRQHGLGVGRGTAGGKWIAPGQPAPPNRVRDRFVSLPDEFRGPLQGPDGAAEVEAAAVPTIFEDLIMRGGEAGLRGKITTYCVSESIDRKVLEAGLREQSTTVALHSFEDVIYARYESHKPNIDPVWGDIFYFDYGVIVFWNLGPYEERSLIRTLVEPAMIDPLPAMEVEIDEFAFNYTATDKPHIQNDTFTISYRLAGDHLLKLSISHALAQSTKLTVYEQRVVEIVEETRDLPELLASTGQVNVSRKRIAQLMGRVFIQKSAVNLLSTVLDTPEFFWSAPDAMQALYKSSCEYLEFFNRVEVLNSRFSVLQEMLEMIRDHQNNYHTARLEWIVIWLIVVEVVVGLFECLSMAGWVGKE